MNDPKSTLVDRLVRIGQEINSIQKDGNNSYKKYKYARAEAILHEVKQKMFAEGVLAYVSMIEVVAATPDECCAVYTITFTDGETSLDVKALAGAKDLGDKATSKTNTFGLKYGLRHMLLIDWGENTDPEADERVDKSGATRKDILAMIEQAETKDELKAVRDTLKSVRTSMLEKDFLKVQKILLDRAKELSI